ncbi:hypothetical protein FOA52_014695 [Chlamydomonas sp. UWO 241]|nr:hypothetical protein FOA52_014695 [Chlamydomonas sp. UWO 241]
MPPSILLLALLLASSCTRAQVHLRDRVNPSAADSYEQAAPWTAPPQVASQFPWKGLHTDLDALLGVQKTPETSVLPGWVTIVTMTGMIQRWVTNCLYSLTKYGGGGHHYIVAVFDEQSLEVCLKLHLPCYYGVKHLPEGAAHQVTDGAHVVLSRGAKNVQWGKPLLALEILRRNVSVHCSDVDIVYFRDLHLNLARVFKTYHADTIWGREDAYVDKEIVEPHTWENYVNIMNSGFFALHAGPRTINLLEQWASPRNIKTYNDQEAINRLHTAAYATCATPPQCMHASHRRNVTTVWMHPHLYRTTSCIQESWEPPQSVGGACDPRRVYLHFLCIAGWDMKHASWRAPEDEEPDSSGRAGPSAPTNYFDTVVCRNCRKRRADGHKLLTCSGCKIVYYCSKECQNESWRNGGHKQV